MSVCKKRKYRTWQRLSDSTRHLVETCENAKGSPRKHGESIAFDFIKEGQDMSVTHPRRPIADALMSITSVRSCVHMRPEEF